MIHIKFPATRYTYKCGVAFGLNVHHRPFLCLYVYNPELSLWIS